ncbi:PIR Superfamily Protein [Plasmodium ovale curtisi]|uniref:PIR Superfamily Protein n=1 Tax=Plasmodium ovale curtisi TaxID=864141 RepID=A0A1A8X145_PLAOA|nr:PIR Superfamily Protein [Plasmodium ovale curtisi]
MEGRIAEGPDEFTENYLSTLPSVRFYNDVEKNHEDLSNYSEMCEQIIRGRVTDEVKTNCKKFLRHLERSTLWDVSNPGYDICLLLNYWIYDKLTHIFGDKYKTDIFFGYFQYIWGYPTDYIKKNISYKEKCMYDFDIHKQEEWKKSKEFYDLCVDYDTLDIMITTYVDKCNDFYKYIERKEELYKHFEHVCTNEPTKCPKFYEKCKHRNPSILLSKLSCYNEILKKKVAAQPQGVQREPASEHYSLDSGLPEAISGHPNAQTTSETLQIGTKVGHTVLGIAPVLLSATALYRYTPVGTWVRKLSGYSPNSISDMDGVVEGFSGNTQETDDMLFGNTGNYISYQPI